MNGVAQDQHQPHPTLGTHLVLKGLKMLAGWLGLITLLAFPLQLAFHPLPRPGQSEPHDWLRAGHLTQPGPRRMCPRVHATAIGKDVLSSLVGQVGRM